MTIDKSKLMTRAWDIRKATGCGMSPAMVQAWAEAKGTDEIGTEVKVAFPALNKNDWLEDNDKEIAEDSHATTCVIRKVVRLTAKEFEAVSYSLLENRPEMWEKIGGAEIDDKHLEDIKPGSDEWYAAWGLFSIINVVKVENDNGNAFYVNTEGYNYARYVGRAA